MQSYNVSEIMSFIDDSKLEELGRLHQIDKVNHKITGSFILKTFVRSVLLGRPISLRSIEEMVQYSSDLSNLLKVNSSSDSSNKSDSKTKPTIDHSSIGKRLEKIESGYYRDIYEDLVKKCDNLTESKEKLHRFDSTIINLSGRMIKDGLKIGGKHNDSQIKITVSLKDEIPHSTRFCSNQSDANEDIALVKAINESKIDKDSILLFDRGISSVTTYQDLTIQEIKFITRVKLDRKYLSIRQNQLNELNESDLKIQSDEIVNLYSAKKLISCNLRLIKGVNKEGKQIWFLTNLFEAKPEYIAQMYKSRWDIEVFFKFIKQNLSFKTFISHTKNGMTTYIYCILIAAILFTIFKISNKLKGFKIPLLRFTLLLEKEIIKDLILLSGGDPKLVEHRL